MEGRPKRIQEDRTPTRPEGWYGLSKLLADEMCIACHATYGMPVTVLRFGYCCGAGEFLDFKPFRLSHLRSIHPELDALWEREERLVVSMNDSGAPYRMQITDVRDQVRGCVSALAKPRSMGQRIQLAGPSSFSFGEAVPYLSKRIGIPATISGPPTNFEFDLDKARRLIGRVMSRVQGDIQQLQELLNISVFATANAVGLVGVIIAMLVMDLRLGLITLASVTLIIPGLMVWQRYARLSFLHAREAIADVSSRLQEGLTAVRVIQSLNREKANIREFGEANRKNLDANLKAARFSEALFPSVEAVNAIGLALVVFFGGSMVLSGSIEVGVLVAFALYLQRFYEPMERLTRDFGQVQKAMVSAARIFEILDIEPEVADRPGATRLSDVRGAVRFEGVGFAYNPDAPVLEDINLVIEPGETVALVGPTGAGKTTLASLLLRFYDVTQGRITIDGYDLRDVTLDSLASQIGVVLQKPYLFSGTVRENIRYSNAGADDQAVERAARAVGAHEFITGLDLGYDTELHERGGNLSVGQRQLISFARALVADPRVLILDEATANIDTYSEMLIQRALAGLLADRTSIVIAHRRSTIRNADRIVVVDQGRIAEQGTHAELMALAASTPACRCIRRAEDPVRYVAIHDLEEDYIARYRDTRVRPNR